MSALVHQIDIVFNEIKKDKYIGLTRAVTLQEILNRKI